MIRHAGGDKATFLDIIAIFFTALGLVLFNLEIRQMGFYLFAGSCCFGVLNTFVAGLATQRDHFLGAAILWTLWAGITSGFMAPTGQFEHMIHFRILPLTICSEALIGFFAEVIHHRRNRRETR